MSDDSLGMMLIIMSVWFSGKFMTLSGFFRCNRILGYCAENCESAGAANSAFSPSVMLTRTVPSAWLVSDFKSLVMECSVWSNRDSAFASADPFWVSLTPRGVEMKSCEPTTSCRRLTCRLTVGWLVLVISAARLNDLVLATARKTRNSPQNCPLRRASSSSELLLNDCCSSSNGCMASPRVDGTMTHILSVSSAESPPTSGGVAARRKRTPCDFRSSGRAHHDLLSTQIALAQEDIKPGADDDRRTQDRCRRRHVAENDIAEHHGPDDHRILIWRHHTCRRKFERT